jgi:hypothetical protein
VKNTAGKCCRLFNVKGIFRKEEAIMNGIYKEKHKTRGLYPAPPVIDFE